MYDTVTLRLTIADVDGVNLIETVAPRLHDCKHVTKSGAVRIEGKTNGMIVTARRDVLRVSGSLCKYYHGDNIKQMTRNDARAAIDQLGERLGISIRAAEVERVDVSVNVTAPQPLKLYNAVMGEMAGAYKDIFGKGHGLTYKPKNSRHKWALLLYDKAREAKRDIYALSLVGLNVLRCELQLQNRQTIKTLLGVSELRASDLWSGKVYNKLKDIVMNKIEAIESNQRVTIAGDVSSTKDMSLKTLSVYCHVEGLDNVVAEFEWGLCKGLPPTAAQRKAITRFKAQCKEAVERYTRKTDSPADDLKARLGSAIRAAK